MDWKDILSLVVDLFILIYEIIKKVLNRKAQDRIPYLKCKPSITGNQQEKHHGGIILKNTGKYIFILKGVWYRINTSKRLFVL